MTGLILLLTDLSLWSPQTELAIKTGTFLCRDCCCFFYSRFYGRVTTIRVVSYCESLFAYYFGIWWLKIYSRKFKFAMHYVFLWRVYMFKYFAVMLNTPAIKFANISENEVLGNNRELKILTLFLGRLRLPQLFTSSKSKNSCRNYLSCLMTKSTKWSVLPAKTQISLGICPVWSVFAVRSVGS